VVANDLNKAILAKLIEQKIIDPAPIPQLQIVDFEKLLAADRQAQLDHAQPRRLGDAAASS